MKNLSVTIDGVTYTLAALNLDQYESSFLDDGGEPLKRANVSAALRDSLTNANCSDNPPFEQVPAGVAMKLISHVMTVSGFDKPEGEAQAPAEA